MKTFLPVLVLAATCAFAQQPNRQPNATPPSNRPATDQQVPGAQNPTPDAQAPTQTDANSTTIHGCLGTGANNSYTITEDKTGTAYTLVGKDFSSLSSHVGQEVEADGQPTAAASTESSASAANNATTASATNFRVTHMRKVGDKCTSPKPSSSLETVSPVMMAYAQTTGSAAGAQSAQPGASSPGANGSTPTTGMSTSPQTSTPGQSTPSTAMPTTPPPTSPGTVNDSTPGTAATPGGAGSSNNNAAGTQPPCATSSTAPCSPAWHGPGPDAKHSS